MTHIRFGNVGVRDFAALVGARFTEEELAHLDAARSGLAALTGAEDFHVFDDPALVVHVGSRESKTLAVLTAANSRRPFDRQVTVHLDERWRSEQT